jgi:hypothetical protein
MGVCLCKDKVEDQTNEERDDIYTLVRAQENGTRSIERLESRVDELVRETLDVIASIVDEEPDTPNSMLLLHNITDRPKGWLCLVKSLIRVVSILI